MEVTQAPANKRDNIPRRPLGILLIIGPRTLDGGYSSPSQVISSAKSAELVTGAETMGAEALKATLLVATGANAETVANAKRERKRLSLFILIV